MIRLGSWPTIRFSTALSPLSWIKRVTSPALTEKACQLMTVLGAFVIENTFPFWEKVACPLTTCGDEGTAWALPKQEATSSAASVRSGIGELS